MYMLTRLSSGSQFTRGASSQHSKMSFDKIDKYSDILGMLSGEVNTQKCIIVSVLIKFY
jgi:hypothetical protein